MNVIVELQKASDKVPHDRMIVKIRTFRVVDGVVNWIENCLYLDRGGKEWVSVGGCHTGKFNWRRTTAISVTTAVICNLYQ